jgi:hypothetical protein
MIKFMTRIFSSSSSSSSASSSCGCTTTFAAVYVDVGIVMQTKQDERIRFLARFLLACLVRDSSFKVVHGFVERTVGICE